MVLYKRKQVTFVRPPPIPEDLATQIYIIPQTKEWFLEYEDYLTRMDYYHRRKFVCEITGNSCLTYFEAYHSELKEIKDLEASFPDALREHILKYLQFNRISRLDLLVDKVYSVFKNEYFPGEDVLVKKVVTAKERGASNKPAENDNSSLSYMSPVKQRGTIREKVQYNNPPETMYLVSTDGDGSQIIATNKQISRDRNHYTKWLVKTFVKLTVTRSHKVGAPWVVKDKFAKKYRIPSEFPDDLKHFAAVTPSGEILYEGDERLDSPSPSIDASDSKQKKTRGRSLKKKATLNAAAASAANATTPLHDIIVTKINPKNELRSRFPQHHLPPSIQKELEQNDFVTTSSFQPSKKSVVEDLHLKFDLQTTRPVPHTLILHDNARTLNSQSIQRIQDHIDDTASETSTKDEANVKLQKQVSILKRDSLHSVQEALECWVFLNIYHSVLKIDTFTFDDFIYAMGWNDEDFKREGRCELLDEIWCATLSMILSNDIPPSKNTDDDKIYGLQVTLPPDVTLLKEELAQNGVSGSEEDGAKGSDSEQETRPLKIEDEASAPESVSPDPLNTVGDTSQNVPDGNDAKTVKEEEASGDETASNEENYRHYAYSVMNHRGTKWHERLRKRNFKDGNWQTIILGVLSLVEYVPEFSDTIQETYTVLAPLSTPNPTPSSVLSQFYTYMGIDLRLKVLYILISLVVNGNRVRDYIDESLDASVVLRRTRLDTIRDLKAASDAANKVHSDIFAKLMEGANSTTDPGLWALFSRKKHRLNMKGYEMTNYEKSLAESDPSFQKLWNEREAGIAKVKETRQAKKDVEMKLSQLDCQRVRLLGKDRHFNRYWWFENNGLPNLRFSQESDEDEDQPEPESDDEFDDKEEFSVETYLMGRLWVQGPSKMDLFSNIKLTAEEADELVGKSDAFYDLRQKENFDAHSNGTSEPELYQLDDGGPPLRIMNFGSVPKKIVEEAEKRGLKYTEHSIVNADDNEVIDKFGALPNEIKPEVFSPVQRKLIEETPIPLFLGDQWRYFDTSEEIEALVRWLNPWGKRESLLRKELLRVKDGLNASINARRKALWLDKLPKDEAELETNIEAVKKRREVMKQGEPENMEVEDSEGEVISRKRPQRKSAQGPNKRRKTVAETIELGSLEELEQLQNELNGILVRKVAENQITRVTEWVNRAARDEFDKSLYEGGDRAKTKSKKNKK